MSFFVHFIAADYTPPPGFEGFIGNIAYIAVTLAAIMHILRGRQTKSVRLEGNLASTDYVDTLCEKLLSEKTFDDYKGHAEHDRSELRRVVDEVKASVKETGQKIERFSGDNYNSRRRMHKKINAHANALFFMAGQHPSGAAIKRILEQADGAGDDGDDS